jgi:hypothetical protein
MSFRFTSIYGVDFSGAKLAGRNIWIARAEPVETPPPNPVGSSGGNADRVDRPSRLRLMELHRLEDLAGAADREAALAHLVDRIGRSRKALWGIDFPFGLPIEVMQPGSVWESQIQLARAWDKGAIELGRWCVAIARTLGERMHIRRITDSETKTPFDCYHYRIIYQTFHGMRDVLAPLLNRSGTIIAPFQTATANTARVICEACPSSTLKRMNLPHQNYKQPAGGPLTPRRRLTRRAILDAIARRIEISDRHRRTIMRNCGGDALDAVIAALGVSDAWRAADHRAIRNHPRYRLEGYVYA